MLTMDSALDIAVGMESARKNVTELQTPARKSTDVYKVTTTNCYRCGNSGHVPDRCRFQHVKCLTCGKTGHIQRVCRSGPKGLIESLLKQRNPLQRVEETTGHDQSDS